MLSLSYEILPPRLALLPVRAIVGVGFVAHGVAKWSRGPASFGRLLHYLGVPFPAPTAWLVTLLEVFGGLAILAGAAVLLVSIPLIFSMLVAVFTVHLPYGFSSVNTVGLTPAGPRFGPPGYEIGLLYIAALLVLALAGPTAWSVDEYLARHRHRRPPPGERSATIRLQEFDMQRVDTLGRAGLGVSRYGLAFLLILWGSFKFFAFEATAIQPLVSNSPFLSWLYPAFGIRGASAIFGVFEVGAGILIATRPWWPRLSGYASLAASGMFVVTLSFLVTTPGAFGPASPWSGFLLKDVMFLGAALYTAAEALGAAGIERVVARRAVVA